jgi:hypothetical protein
MRHAHAHRSLRLPQKNQKNYRGMRASRIFRNFASLAVGFLLLPDKHSAGGRARLPPSCLSPPCAAPINIAIPILVVS